MNLYPSTNIKKDQIRDGETAKNGVLQPGKHTQSYWEEVLYPHIIITAFIANK